MPASQPLRSHNYLGKAGQLFYSVAPLVFFLLFYWQGLHTWFYQDDFGWLLIRDHVHSWRDIPSAVFAPAAGHRIIRPWSVQGIFLLFPAVFGIDPLPFRICAFVTQIANLLLLGLIVFHLTGSRAAGFWAQILWTANISVAVVACWTSVYNQIQSCFFLLLAFYLLLRYIETGQRRFYIWQWIIFVLGFGALETNIVYPALAAAYALCFERRYLRKILPMFAASAIYAAIHFVGAPAPKQGVYALHIDASIFSTLWTYWTWALGPDRLSRVVLLPAWLPPVATGVLTAAILGLLAYKLWKRQWLFGFAAAWFLIVLAPLLPLRDHIMDYYLTGPAIGLAMFGALAIALEWQKQWLSKAAISATIALYLGASLPAARGIADWHYQRSQAVENLVLGVREIREHNPGKTILLAGMPTELFVLSMAHACFYGVKIPKVYLSPGSEATIEVPRSLVMPYVRPAGIAAKELAENQALVYDASGEVLRNRTGYYRANMHLLIDPERQRSVR